MPLRFRILPAVPEVPAAWLGGGSATPRPEAEGPQAARWFDIESELETVLIGRQPGLEIELPLPAVSAVHARLLRGDLPGDWRVEDLGSMNGTWVDGQRLAPERPVPLRSGQRLRIGTADLIFEGWIARSQADAGDQEGEEGQKDEERQERREPEEGTATIARRLISDLFGGDIPILTLEEATGGLCGELRLEERGRRYLVGREGSCDLVLASDDVSREHAALTRGWEGVLLVDLGSRNGVLVNGERVWGERRLADGDRLVVGTLTLRLTDPEDRYLRRLEALSTPSSSQHLSPVLAVPAAVPAPSSISSSTPENPAAPGPADVVARVEAAGEADAPPAVTTPSSGAGSGRSPASRRILTAIVALIAVAALAGLVALWLTAR